MNFAIMITTHGRPDKQYTYNLLRNIGYNGKIILVVDDEDDTVEALECAYSNDNNTSVVIFNKQKFIDSTDTGTSLKRHKIHTYARNFCESLAKELSLDSFVMADDDMTKFRYRFIEDEKLKTLDVKSADFIQLYNDYMLETDMPMISIGMAQMYFTGVEFEQSLWKWRVPYTFIFRNVKHEVVWVAEFQEEIITAINQSLKGKYCMVVPHIQHDTLTLGDTSGGMYESYKENEFKNAQFGHMWHPTAEIPKKYKDKWMSMIQRDNAFAKLISSKHKLL